MCETDKPKTKKKPKRQAIYELCNGVCHYCGLKLTLSGKSDNGMTVDHVIPISKGGRRRLSNCVAACRTCNSLKGDKLKEDFLESLGVCYKCDT